MCIGRDREGVCEGIHCAIGNVRPEGVLDRGHSAPMSDVPRVEFPFRGLWEDSVQQCVNWLAFEDLLEDLRFVFEAKVTIIPHCSESIEHGRRFS